MGAKSKELSAATGVVTETVVRTLVAVTEGLVPEATTTREGSSVDFWSSTFV